MKKPLFIMTTILVMLCLVYSYTNVEAKSPDDYTVKVVDFTQGDGSGETTEGADQSSQDSAKTFVAGEGAGASDTSSGTTGGTTSGTGTTSGGNSSSGNGGNIFDGQSGKDAADELIQGSEPDILGDDYQFGDDILKTDQTTEGFFQHVYNKTWEAFTGVQKVFTVIVLFCFIVSAVMTLLSIFGKKEKVLWYAFAMLLCLIILICVIYAPQIAAAFNKWFVTT